MNPEDDMIRAASASSDTVDDLLDELIARASITNLAQLTKQGLDAGLLQRTQAYQPPWAKP